jgi:hypothetical protein
MDWMNIQKILTDSWIAISHAPVPILGLMLLAFIIGWSLQRVIHHAKVDALEERLRLAVDQGTAATSVASAQLQEPPANAGIGLYPLTGADQQLATLQRPNVHPLILQQEDRIRSDLHRLSLSQKPVDPPPLLVENLATAQLLLSAEQTYRVIFGSQINALKHLNIAYFVTRSQIKDFYDSASLQFPQLYSKYTFDQYIGFLEARGLITSDDCGRYSITPAGQAFLQWLSANRISETKPF